jgi:hypothetical protein
MAFVYEINGKRVEFEKEPTDRDIDDAAKSMGISAQKPESRQPKPVEGAGGAAFGVYRQAGRRPENQQDREAALDMPLQTVRGAASNVGLVAGLPADIANAVYNAPRTAQDIANRYQSVRSQLAGNERQPLPELPAKQKVPVIGEYGSEFFNQFVPGPEPTSPAGQLAFAGGQVMGAPVATKTMSVAAPIITSPIQTAKAVGQTAKNVAQVPVDVAKGAFGRATGYIADPGATPGPFQVKSARNQLDTTYIDPEGVKLYEAGKLSYQDLISNYTKPIGELAQTSAEKAALAMSGGTIPFKGQASKAFGERIGETYRNPYTAAFDLASMFNPIVPGVPVLSALRTGYAGAQAVADRILSKKGFSAELPKQLRESEVGLRPSNYNNQVGYQQAQPTMYGTQGGIVATDPLAAVRAQLNKQYPPFTVAGAANPNQTLTVKPTNIKEFNTADLLARRDRLEKLNADAIVSGRPVGPIPDELQNIKPTRTAEEIASELLAAKQRTDAITAQIRSRATPAVAETTGPAVPTTSAISTAIPQERMATTPVTKTQPAPIAKAEQTVAERNAEILAKREQAIRMNEIFAAQGRDFRVAVPELPGPSAGMTKLQQALKSMEVEDMPRYKPVEVNPELDVPQIKPLSSIREKLASRTPEQIAADEAAVKASENRSAAQKAAQSTRGNIQNDVRSTTKAAVNSKLNKLSIDKELINDMAAERGVLVDWSNAPDIRNMSVKDGRRALDQFLYKDIAEKVRGLNDGTYTPETPVVTASERMSAKFKSQGGNNNTMGLITDEPINMAARRGSKNNGFATIDDAIKYIKSTPARSASSNAQYTESGHRVTSRVDKPVKAKFDSNLEFDIHINNPISSVYEQQLVGVDKTTGTPVVAKILPKQTSVLDPAVEVYDIKNGKEALRTVVDGQYNTVDNTKLGSYSNPYASKADFQRATTFNKLSEKPYKGTYKEGNDLVQELVDPVKKVKQTARYTTEGNNTKISTTQIIDDFANEGKKSISTGIFKIDAPEDVFSSPKKSTYFGSPDFTMAAKGNRYIKTSIQDYLIDGDLSSPITQIVKQVDNKVYVQTQYTSGKIFEEYEVKPIPFWEAKGTEPTSIKRIGTWDEDINTTQGSNATRTRPHPLGANWDKPMPENFGDVKKANPFKKK